jgi:hypothetical protein
MTFEQALKIKNDIGETILIYGRNHNVYVGPYDQDDFDLWKIACNENNSFFNQISITDELGKEYSKNSKFKVYGIFEDSTLQLYNLKNELFTMNTTSRK